MFYLTEKSFKLGSSCFSYRIRIHWRVSPREQNW